MYTPTKVPKIPIVVKRAGFIERLFVKENRLSRGASIIRKKKITRRLNGRECKPIYIPVTMPMILKIRIINGFFEALFNRGIFVKIWGGNSHQSGSKPYEKESQNNPSE